MKTLRNDENTQERWKVVEEYAVIKEPAVDGLIHSIRAGARPTYFLFWGHRASGGYTVGKWCLSQWWPAAFTVEGTTYPTAEHFMMVAKARLFADASAALRNRAS